MPRQRSNPNVSGTLLRAEMLRLDPVAVNFAAYLELSGLAATFEADHLEMSLRFRILRGLYRPLTWHFSVLDKRGEKLLEGAVPIDHQVLPFGGWPADDLLLHVKSNIASNDQPPAEVEFGVCEAPGNIPLPVCATSLPVTSDYTAVRARLSETPSANLLYSFGWPGLKSCRVTLEDGVELLAYSLQYSGGRMWLRLKWQIRARPGHRFGILGCIMPSGLRHQTAMTNLEQEIFLRPEASLQVVEQNIICRIDSTPGADALLRIGVFVMQTKALLQVLDCSLTAPAESCYFFLSFPASESEALGPISGRQLL